MIVRIPKHDLNHKVPHKFGPLQDTTPIILDNGILVKRYPNLVHQEMPKRL
jgi:hypothetical protein